MKTLVTFFLSCLACVAIAQTSSTAGSLSVGGTLTVVTNAASGNVALGVSGIITNLSFGGGLGYGSTIKGSTNGWEFGTTVPDYANIGASGIYAINNTAQYLGLTTASSGTKAAMTHFARLYTTGSGVVAFCGAGSSSASKFLFASPAYPNGGSNATIVISTPVPGTAPVITFMNATNGPEDVIVAGTVTVTNGYNLPPNTAPSGITNGLARFWNSNGVVFLRTSTAGSATEGTDKQIAP